MVYIILIIISFCVGFIIAKGLTKSDFERIDYPGELVVSEEPDGEKLIYLAVNNDFLDIIPDTGCVTLKIVKTKQKR